MDGWMIVTLPKTANFAAKSSTEVGRRKDGKKEGGHEKYHALAPRSLRFPMCKPRSQCHAAATATAHESMGKGLGRTEVAGWQHILKSFPFL